MRVRHLASLALAIAASVGSLHAVETTPPEAVIAAPLQALRKNDVLALLNSRPADEQAKARAEWKNLATTLSPTQRAEFDEKLAMLLSPTAVDDLMRQIEPLLKQMNPQESAGMLQMVGGMAVMQLAQKPGMAATSKGLQTLILDLAGWLPSAGLESPQKMRQALTSVVNAAKSLGIATSDDLLKLDLDEVLRRGGAALKVAKTAFTPYGIDVDSFLDSIALINVTGTGDKRAADLKLTAFGHDLTVPMPLAQTAGSWGVDEEALHKLVGQLMGGLNMGGGGAGEL